MGLDEVLCGGPGTRPSMDQATEAPATEKIGTTVIPILHMGQLRHNQAKDLLSIPQRGGGEAGLSTAWALAVMSQRKPVAGAQRRGAASFSREGSCGGPVELPSPLIHHDVGEPCPQRAGPRTVATASLGPLRPVYWELNWQTGRVLRALEP